MKQPKRLRKVSPSRERMLSSESGRNFLLHNSTIRRKPCNAITAVRKYGDTKVETRKGNTWLLSSLDSISVNPFTEHASTVLPSNYTKQRKPVRKQSKKQQARLTKLASIRQRWWRESQETGRPLSCGICDEEIRSFEDLASDHVEPGNAKSDSENNLQPAHQLCNLIKSSQRNFKIVRGDHNWKLIHGLL